MWRSALVLCLLAAVCGAAHPSRPRGLKPDNGDRIVGGDPVSISQFPWQVSLEKREDDRLKHFCGGSIISSAWVLTAAHCILNFTPQEVYVRAGSSFRENGGIVYNVTTIIAHEDYNRYMTNDFDYGLLEISEPIDFGSKVQAVNLGSTEIVTGTEVNVTGWGSSLEGGEQPLQLQAVTLSIVDRDACKAAHASWDMIVTQHMVCAGREGGGKDACQRDDGGPLVVGNTQYGVFSWGKGCARPDFPGVYSNVPAARAWITEKTAV